MAEIPVSEYQVDPMINEMTTEAFDRTMDSGSGGYSQGLLEGTDVRPSFDMTNTMNDAINRRAMRSYNLSQAELGAKANQYGQQYQTERVAKVNKLLQEEKKLNDMVREMKERAEMDRKAARAGVLGNILGIGGAAVGAMTGGPVGAMAGYQLGSGAGQMAGSGGM